MSEDQKIIEYEEIKYYLEEGQCYRLLPIVGGDVPAVIKAKKLVKISLPQENLLDVFKFLDFDELLSFQQTSFYFKNIVDKYGKELAGKKFTTLRFQRLCDIELDERRLAEIEPHLYDFELSRKLEQKWIRGIEEQVPMFLTSFPQASISTVICELEHFTKWEKKRFYSPYQIQLPNLPQNLEQMAIARYFFKLLFNSAFQFFEIDLIIINPQMIQLLLDETTTNMPLQIHSKITHLYLYDDHPLNFVSNHLFSDLLCVDIQRPIDLAKSFNPLFKILANGGNRFSDIYYARNISFIFYDSIIEYIETSQDISKIVKPIRFYVMSGPLNSSKKAENTKIEIYNGIKYTTFQLSNKHNPEIKFSVRIREDVSNMEGNPVSSFIIFIKRIN